MKANIGRKEISDLIYKRLDKTVSKKYIRCAVNIICEEIVGMLLDNENISVRNFGILNPYLFHSHKGFNVQTGKVQEYPEFWSAKFHTHAAFEKLLDEKKEFFKENS